MPPIKRTQKQAAAPATRRIAGHGGATRREIDTDATAETGTGLETGGGSRRRSLARPLTIGALAVGLVAGVGGAAGLIYLALSDGAEPANQAFVDQAATEAVLTAATTNVQRLVSIDHESLDEYHDSLGEFLTPNLVEELDKNWPTLKDSYEQSATTVDAQVREAGLSYLEGDRAEVLLVQDVSMERDGAAVGSTSGTYLVGLDRVDGVWKLSRIPDLPS